MTQIRSAKQYEAIVSRIDELLTVVDGNTPEDSKAFIELDILSGLVADYENIHYPIPERIARKESTYKFEPENVWFTADTHFYHENIIRFCSRPFANASEMNNELIRRWNETVPPDGTVFHLGDFSFGSAKEWNNILYQLHGKIYLILGNHDMEQIRQGFMKRFELVTQQMSIRVGSQGVILNHNPFLTYGGCYRNTWQLFGHVHSGPRSDKGKDLSRLRNLLPRQYDVGVDNNDYRPVSFANIKKIIEK